MAVNSALLRAWLAGRSLARGLPPPTAEHGGFRIDTNSEAEVCRWVFPALSADIASLAERHRDPRYLLKLCGDADELASAISGEWVCEDRNYVMVAGGARFVPRLPEGYRSTVSREGAVVSVRILAPDGALAASGCAGETAAAFVYDRIVTDPAHGRRGLGRTVMAALQAEKRTAAPELLVATDQGRALYEQLGWRTLSRYATASFTG